MVSQPVDLHFRGSRVWLFGLLIRSLIKFRQEHNQVYQEPNQILSRPLSYAWRFAGADKAAAAL